MSLKIIIWNSELNKETLAFIIKISIIFNKIKLNHLFLFVLRTSIDTSNDLYH